MFKSAGFPAEYDTTIPPTEAYQYARFAYLDKSALFKEWQAASLAISPELVHDITGGLLFYRFAIRDRLAEIGNVLVAADCRLLQPIIQIRNGYDRVFKGGPPSRGKGQVANLVHAVELAKAAYPEADVIDAFTVCYSYPKMGIQVLLAEPDSQFGQELTRFIVDLATGQPVAELPEGGVDGEETEGHEAYSLLRRIAPEARAHKSAAERAEVAKVYRQSFDENAKAILGLIDAIDDSEGGGVGGIAQEQKEVVLAKSYLDQSGAFPAIAQIDTYHCALASAEMIISYLTGDAPSQEKLETPFKKGPFGTTNKNQIRGYRTVLEASDFKPMQLDETPTPAEITDSIDAKLPMKSGVPRHARVCAGYRSSQYPATERNPAFEAFELFIQDPWPPNEGNQYWEPWNSVLHTNCIYFTGKNVAEDEG